MPAWKNREAGRRGRDHVEGVDYYDSRDRMDNRFPRSDHLRSRVERLTKTATAIGRGRPSGAGGYDNPDHDLDDVADELDRLLSERDDRPAPPRDRPMPWVEAPEAPRRKGQQPGTRQRDLRENPSNEDERLETVLGALERLDRQVQGLAAKQAVGEQDAGPDDQYFDQDGPDIASGLQDRFGPSGRGPSRRGESAQRTSRRSARLGSAEHYDDYERPDGEYDDYDEFDGMEEPPLRASASDFGAQRAGPARAHKRAGEDASLTLYKDLGRRIDALRKPQEEAFEQVREELGSLRSALGGLSKGTHEKVNRQNAELRRLSDMVERLRADRHGEQFAKEVRQEVADLKALVGRTNVEGALESLEHGYAHILQRLDELSRAAVDPRILKGVTARLNEIEDAFAALPRSEHFLVLEDRISTISERMEELLRQKGHQEIEPLRAELREVRQFVEHIDVSGLLEGIDDRMKFVSGRLDDLETLAREQRGLDTRLSAMEERMPAPETLSRLQGRLEDIVGMMAEDKAAMGEHHGLGNVGHRLDEIAGRLERIESQPIAAPDTSAFRTLEKRLEAISSKIEVIEKRSSRPMPVLDASSLKGASADTKLMAQLQSRLNDLSDRLDQPRDTVTTADLDKLRSEIGAMRAAVPAAQSTEALEQRISELAAVVERGGDNLDDKRIELLAGKVSALAEQLENSSGRDKDLEAVTSALSRIETGLQDTRRDVVDIAKTAALEAVASQPGQGGGDYDDAIAGLQGDLKRLLDAAEGSEERTRNTFDGVQSVLSSVTERLESLERSNVTKPAAAASFLAEADRGAMPAQRREMTAENMVRQPGAIEDPGVEQRMEPTAQDKSRDRKADFIAAARRAAQAASAEASKVETTSRFRQGVASQFTNEGESGKERAGWFRNVLKRTKKDTDTADALDPVEPTIAGNAGADAADAYAEPQPILAGDQPRADASDDKDVPATGGGGRRKALLFAAAAVVLAIGTLQVFNMVSGPASDGDEVAVTDEAETGADTSVVAGQPSGATPDDGQATPVADAAAPAQGNVSSLDAGTVSPSQTTPVATTPATTPVSGPSRGAGGPGSGDGGSPAAPQPEVAFAPPSGVNNGFNADGPPADGFNLPGTNAAQPASLVANLPPESVGPLALRSAAASGDPRAAFLVGVKFTEGDGVPADLTEAAKWYQIAADQGLAPAQYRLASLYEKGRGVELDLDKARAWYEQSAQAGNSKAMHNLAVLYAEGAGGAPDFERAAQWFESAAEYGVKDSLFNLGILYARGLGVEKDLVQSYKWFAIAAREGDQDAAKKRDDVANTMDEAALNRARATVEAFQLKTPAPDANKVMTEPDWAAAGASPTTVNLDNVVDYEAMVRTVQTKLNALGFDTGTPDGQIGPRTRSAVRAFQRSIGMPETGEIDAVLVQELESQQI